MASLETAKPATAETVNGLRNIEQLGGRLYDQDTRTLSEIQAFRLQRRFGFAYATAVAISAIVFAAGPR